MWKTKSAALLRAWALGLCRMFAELQKAELSVKSGARQPLQAIEELVASLSLVFAPEQGRTSVGR